MQFALKVAILEYSILKHSQGILGSIEEVVELGIIDL